MDKRLKASPLEEQVGRELGHLAAVCRAPHARLHTEHVLVPVSKARTITWRTVTHLAAHSETWAARRLRGVEPAQLLTPVTLPDYDLYENQVVAALLDGLWRHVLDRISELNSIHDLIAHGQDFLDEARGRPSWRDRERLFEDISELVSDRHLAGRLEEQRDQLEGLRTALAPLLASTLRKGVRLPYSGPPRLRPTNLFMNDVNYRHCRGLWDAWVRLRQSDGGYADDAAVVDWCRDFTRYAALIVLRALAQLGTDLNSRDSVPSWPQLRFGYRSADADITWNDDDTFTVSLSNVPVLRIVPLPHALTASQDAYLAEEVLADMVIEMTHRIAVLYPADHRERMALPVGVRLRLHSSWPTTDEDASTPAMVPVSPSDINSVGRTARLIRTALDEHILLDYPMRVACPSKIAISLASGSKWVEAEHNELLVVSPPSDGELTALLDTMSHFRVDASRAHQRGDNFGSIQKLIADLEHAAVKVRALTLCPVCHRSATHPGRAFQKWENRTYRCHCSSCGTTWGTRRCVFCGEAHTVLATSGAEKHVGGDGDLIDRCFSQDVLTLPCWARARSYICSSCGRCPETGMAECVRCESVGEQPL
ncbi:hypothetical protein ACWDOR_35750 [Streptosporangium canum]